MARRLMWELGRMVRETGQAVDRLGLRVLENPIYAEPFSRHRSVMNLFDKHPNVSPDAFVAPSASVVGNVFIKNKSAVWYGAVVRGDLSDIFVGHSSTIGDRAVVCTSKSVEGKNNGNCTIGDYVQIGAGAILQSCTIENNAKIGAGAIIMEGALIEEYAEVADGAVVHPGRRVPSGQLWEGNPATFKEMLSKSKMADTQFQAEAQCDLAGDHAHQFLPYSTSYQEAEMMGAADPRVQEIAEQQRQKATGTEQLRDLTPTEAEVEAAVSPAPGYRPPPGKTVVGAVDKAEAIKRGQSIINSEREG